MEQDNINPSHYKQSPSGIEAIQVTRWMNFNLGNAMKYIWRAGLKNADPTEDIEKAIWYLRDELTRVSIEQHRELLAHQDAEKLLFVEQHQKEDELHESYQDESIQKEETNSAQPTIFEKFNEAFYNTATRLGLIRGDAAGKE